MAPVQASSVATLRSLYPRAARAFLQRDVASTQALITEAFSRLPPPVSSLTDALSSHRRQWDVLRITFETSLYSSPSLPSSHLPPALASILTLSPQALLNTLYIRSLTLFSPTPSSPSASTSSQKPNAAHLPAQILVVLAYAALKLDSPQIARDMVEDWLARRPEIQIDKAGYERVVEVYCLHLLPRLNQWDYASDFLMYDGELDDEKKTSMVRALQTLRAQPPVSFRSPIPSPSVTPTSSSRASTPSPSTELPPRPSSRSSSVSSTSTHTAVPLTRHGPGGNVSPATPPPLARASSPKTNGTPSGYTITEAPAPTSLSTAVPTSTPTSSRSLLQIVTRFLPDYLKSNLPFLFIVLLPLLTLMLRFGRRGKTRHGNRIGSGAGAATPAGSNSMISWFGRAVWDTVMMGGRGLV